MDEGRRVRVAVDLSACSRKALCWAVDDVVRTVDHLVLGTVLPEGNYEEGEMQLWEVTGSPFIPLHEISDPAVMKRYGVKLDAENPGYRQHCGEQEVEVLSKIYWGNAREKLCEAIDKIPLSFIVIGNRGLGRIKR